MRRWLLSCYAWLWLLQGDAGRAPSVSVMFPVCPFRVLPQREVAAISGGNAHGAGVADDRASVSITVGKVAKPTTKEDGCVISNGQVLGVTSCLESHPSGKIVALSFAGKDASEEFNVTYLPGVIGEYAPDYVLEPLVSAGADRRPGRPPNAERAHERRRLLAIHA